MMPHFLESSMTKKTIFWNKAPDIASILPKLALSPPKKPVPTLLSPSCHICTKDVITLLEELVRG